MDVTPLIKEGQNIVQNYQDGGFTISGQRYKGGIILMPTQLFEWDVPKNFESLTVQNFQSVIDHKENCDVFLFGAGKYMRFLPQPLKAALIKEGINFDVMDTGAACRTYNVLMAEGRRVLCVMMPV